VGVPLLCDAINEAAVTEVAELQVIGMASHESGDRIFAQASEG
jgi:hypothetical protein